MKSKAQWNIIDALCIAAGIYLMGAIIGAVFFTVGIGGWIPMIAAGFSLLGYLLCLGILSTQYANPRA